MREREIFLAEQFIFQRSGFAEWSVYNTLFPKIKIAQAIGDLVVVFKP